MRVRIIMALVLGVACAVRGDLAKIAAFVLDAETREPLADVEMTAYFEIDNGWMAWKGSAKPNQVRVRTDRDGRCHAAENTNAGHVWWIVNKVPAGYHLPSHGGFVDFERKNLLGVWQPTDVVCTVLVQRVGHPIPLIARHVEKDAMTPARADLIGKAGGRLAYDFLRCDWLPPVGQGETADVVFTREAPEDIGSYVDPLGKTQRAYRQRVTMRFPGKDNGIVELKPPFYAVPLIRTAPEDGYGPGLDFAYGRNTSGEEVKENHLEKHFAFRIRARRDGQGRLVGGYYGKIYGGVEIASSRTEKENVYEDLGEPWFAYYLNPAPLDRNLEWDVKRQLTWNPATKRLENVDWRDRDRLWTFRVRNTP